MGDPECPALFIARDMKDRDQVVSKSEGQAGVRCEKASLWNCSGTNQIVIQ
jgi:hypothetical protein